MSRIDVATGNLSVSPEDRLFILLGGIASPIALRDRIRQNWDEVSRLAHAIHDAPERVTFEEAKRRILQAQALTKIGYHNEVQDLLNFELE